MDEFQYNIEVGKALLIKTQNLQVINKKLINSNI